MLLQGLQEFLGFGVSPVTRLRHTWEGMAWKEEEVVGGRWGGVGAMAGSCADQWRSSWANWSWAMSRGVSLSGVCVRPQRDSFARARAPTARGTRG